MASSPDQTGDGTVRWPLVAKIGLALAVLTITAGIVAALVAAFVVDRDDDSTGKSRAVLMSEEPSGD